jgi:hypothetical protein
VAIEKVSRVVDTFFLLENNREIPFTLQLFQFIQTNPAEVFEVLKAHRDTEIFAESISSKQIYRSIGELIDDNKEKINMKFATWVVNTVNSVVHTHVQNRITNDLFLKMVEHKENQLKKENTLALKIIYFLNENQETVLQILSAHQEIMVFIKSKEPGKRYISIGEALKELQIQSISDFGQNINILVDSITNPLEKKIIQDILTAKMQETNLTQTK